MTMLRWGVLGAANIAKKAVIPAIQAAHNGTVVAIASRERGRAQAAAGGSEIPEVYDDYAALINSAGVDAVYIPLPNSEHRRWTIAALEAGKHVLCEKPLALTAQEAEEMVAAAERAGRLLAEAFMYRHHPLFTKVLELLNSGLIGELRLVRSSFSFVLDRPDDIRWQDSLGGGALMDVGCYGVNLARLTAGAEPTALAGVAEYGPSGVDTSFAAVLRFPRGVLAEVDVSMAAAGGPSYELIGTGGKIVVRQGFRVPADEEGEIQLHQGGDISRIFTDAVDPYQQMIEDFGRAALGQRAFPYPAQDAVANMRVLDGLREAAQRD